MIYRRKDDVSITLLGLGYSQQKGGFLQLVDAETFGRIIQGVGENYYPRIMAAFLLDRIVI